MPCPNSTGLRPPRFNHVFVVVDSATYAAVEACAYLKSEALGRFAAVESESTLVGRYRPIRIFGESTLIELFAERLGGGTEFERVSAGVVLSFDHGGEREAARQRLVDCGVAYRTELIWRRTTDEGPFEPWYHSTRPDLGAASPLALFISEAIPEYLERRGVAVGPDLAQDRAAQLTASLGRPHGPQHALKDIDGLTLRLHPQRALRLARILDPLGYQSAATGGVVTLSGPDIRIDVVADAAAPEGLLEARMRLARPDADPGRRFEFGPASSLVLSPRGPTDDHAVWRFEPRAIA